MAFPSDYVRTLAQRAELDAEELRIMGSKRRIAARTRRRFKRKNGGFWRAQFCTEVAHPTRFERVSFAFGGRVSEFAPICKHLQIFKKPPFYGRFSMDELVDFCWNLRRIAN
jgi:hypothetical protein